MDFKIIVSLIKKEFLICYRSIDRFLALLFLSFVLCSFFCYSLASSFTPIKQIRTMLPSIEWAILFLVATLVSEKMLDSEVRLSAITALRLTKVPLEWVFVSKLIATFFQLFTTFTLIVVSCDGLLGVNSFSVLASRIVPVAISILGFSSLTVLISSATATSRFRSGLLAILLIPLIFPLYISSVALSLPPTFGQPDQNFYATMIVYFFGLILTLSGIFLYPTVIKG